MRAEADLDLAVGAAATTTSQRPSRGHDHRRARHELLGGRGRARAAACRAARAARRGARRRRAGASRRARRRGVGLGGLRADAACGPPRSRGARRAARRAPRRGRRASASRSAPARLLALRAHRGALGLGGLELGEQRGALLLDAAALIGDVREQILDARACGRRAASRARSTTSPAMPMRCATASAPELPGEPRCSLNVGSSRSRSKPTDALAKRESRRAERLQPLVVRGDDAGDAARGERLEHRLRERGALIGIGADGDLVDEHERARRRGREQLAQVHHVAGERREILLEVLRVADVGDARRGTSRSRCRSRR